MLIYHDLNLTFNTLLQMTNEKEITRLLDQVILLRINRLLLRFRSINLIQDMILVKRLWWVGFWVESQSRKLLTLSSINIIKSIQDPKVLCKVHSKDPRRNLLLLNDHLLLRTTKKKLKGLTVFELMRVISKSKRTTVLNSSLK